VPNARVGVTAEGTSGRTRGTHTGSGRVVGKVASSAAAWSVVAGGIGQASVVVSGVALARLLGVEDRGHLALIVLFAAVLPYVGTLGMPLALTYEIARAPVNARALARALVGTAVAQSTALVFLVTVAFSGSPDRVQEAAYLTLLAVPVHVAQQYGYAILQGQQRFAAFNTFRCIPTALYAAVACALFAFGVDDLIAVTACWIAVYAISTAFLLLVVVRALPEAPDNVRVDRLRMFRFGARGLIGSLSPVEAFRLDQVVVGFAFSPAALGLYVIGVAFTSFPKLIALSIGLVAYPRVAASHDRQAAERATWRYFWLSSVVSAGTIVALFPAVPTLIRFFFGSEFAGAATVTRILLVGALFVGMRRILADSAQGAGRPELGTISELLSWVILVPAILILAAQYNTNGVAAAVGLAAVGSVVFLIWAVRRGREFQFVPSLREWTARLVLVGGTVGAGVAAAHAPLIGFVIVLVAVALVGTLLALRNVIAPRTRVAAGRVVENGVETPSEQHLRIPRLVYFLGILTIGQLTLRPALVFTLSDWLFLIALALTAMVVAVNPERPEVELPRLLKYGAVFFALGGIVSSFAAVDWIASVGVTLRFLYLTLLWFWLAIALLRTVKQVATAMLLWVASTALNGLAAVAQLVFGDVVPGSDIVHGRMTGFTGHVNDLGGLCAIALVPAVALLLSARWPSGALLIRLGVVLAVSAGLVLSGSVGGMVAAAAGLAAWLALSRVPSLRVVVVLAAAFVGLAFLTNLQANRGRPTALERFTVVTDDSTEGGGTFWSRLDSFRFAWDAISEDPFLGSGLDEASTLLPTLEQPVHNMLLLPWMGAGAFGFLGFTLIFTSIMSVALRTARMAGGRGLAPALTGALVAFAVFGLGEPILYKRYAWVVAALVLALSAAERRRSRAAQTVETSPQLMRPAAAGAWR
jgi:O-antigen/teichoic acid export membrane protein/O-antigen ligase